jgi:hypothetical protein
MNGDYPPISENIGALKRPGMRLASQGHIDSTVGEKYYLIKEITEE